ncbi:propionyl-CoA synthetase [Rheinheimera nanhaiensis]|uniref:Propionyl-CoA synthetase n=1 Tax=Rheinheimera nanhaiensis E407-8 TaxID=562729 RepID=I1E2N6_9GAMM|nr:propionyl-CoA synthetase [Rheinheimera nanhaiensis]GAB60564.1 propionyl-CoA synthetase [Rheinheimera nanhaiensis E407-8]
MTTQAKQDYQQLYQQAANAPETFWQQQAAKLNWYKAPQQILQQQDAAHYQWFSDGVLNTAYLALDSQVEQGRAEQTALIYDSPVTNSQQRFSYRELRDEVARFAGVLKALGVQKGDRVVIYMPMIPQAAIAMLAVARLGAVHSVVFGGFSAHELALRIDDAKPKVVLSASCGIEISKVIAYKPLLDDAINKAAHKPAHCVIYQRPQLKAELQAGRDLDWQQALLKAEPAACVPVKATDPLYVLYTSGTTGKPKGVVRDNGGHAVALHYSMQAVYNTKPGDVFWAASDVGWVVGHSYIVYAPLIAGCTTVLYEGKPVFTPDASAFWRVCAEHKVNILFAAPTAFRAIRKEDPEAALQQYDLSALRTIFMAGERLDPATYQWVVDKLQKPVIDHWWQTETGWPIAANPAGIALLPAKPGSSTVPVPGFNVQILDEAGQQVKANEQGYIALKLPLPPGCLTTIWGNDARFVDGYLATFPGYYASGDGGYIDDDGYLFVMGRTDDVINVAGHRLSTGEMEQIVASHPAIAECCVIGIPEPIKGQQPMALVLIKNGVEVDETILEAELVAMVREEIGALACFKKALIVKRLPKTRSGKILRKLLRQIADGSQYSVPSTIDDPASLPEIAQLMQARGLLSGS